MYIYAYIYIHIYICIHICIYVIQIHIHRFRESILPLAHCSVVAISCCVAPVPKLTLMWSDASKMARYQ